MNGDAAPVRYRRLWWALGLALTLVVIVASLVPAHELPRTLLTINDKLEHIGAYFGLALWFAALFPVRSYPALALALLALGGGIEIAQGLMGLGRTADWFDFYADAFGVALGLGLGMAGLRHWVRWLESWARPR